MKMWLDADNCEILSAFRSCPLQTKVLEVGTAEERKGKLSQADWPTNVDNRCVL